MGKSQDNLQFVLQSLDKRITDGQLPYLTVETVLDSDYADVVP